MRILLVGNYAPDRQESMLRFAELMQRELKARGHSVELLQPEPLLGKLRPVSSGLGKWLAYVDKFVLFPPKLRAVKHGYDVVHLCDHSNALYVRHIADKPHVVTCHDVLAIKSALGEVPQNPVSGTGRVLQRLILNGLKAAQFIVCDSEATSADLLRLTRRAPDCAAVVYLSMHYPYSPMPRSEALARLDKLGFDARTPFFMHVGSAWYKNRLGLLQIFDKVRKLMAPARLRLLMVGKPLSNRLREQFASNGLEDAMISLSGVSNEDLRAAYSLAQGLIFPSLQEGFGWPVLEAQACGCPVFATGRPPMTEVGGSAAVYIDPSDVAGAAKAIVNARQTRDAIRERGLANVLRFGLTQMMQGYTSAYEQVACMSRK
jgi:glycosyltransferase involved in cell wall biosynthesis